MKEYPNALPKNGDLHPMSVKFVNILVHLVYFTTLVEKKKEIRKERKKMEGLEYSCGEGRDGKSMRGKGNSEIEEFLW